MKAVRYDTFEGPIRLVDVPDPMPPPMASSCEWEPPASAAPIGTEPGSAPALVGAPGGNLGELAVKLHFIAGADHMSSSTFADRLATARLARATADFITSVGDGKGACCLVNPLQVWPD